MGFSSNGFFVIIIQLKLFTMATLGTEESVADVERRLLIGEVEV